ncbi:MAG: UbiA family prenyltransferase [Bacteroidia bacterium]
MKEFYNTIRLLRFPFSMFLLPVTLFSFYFAEPGISVKSALILIIWHLIVFPSSNGYNSYNDKDTGPIGGMARPPAPTKLLWHVTLAMDIVAILLSFLINRYFVFFVIVYILISRLYSARSVRLKRFPVMGFLVVFIFQGAWIFCANIIGLDRAELFLYPAVTISALASSFFIGTVYPLTQIYQHTADKEDGVTTLSMVLGLRGTFIFSATMFLIATILMYLVFNSHGSLINFWLFNIVMLASTVYFLGWAFRSFKNPSHINFKNVMIMLILSSLSNNIYFLILLNK